MPEKASPLTSQLVRRFINLSHTYRSNQVSNTNEQITINIHILCVIHFIIYKGGSCLVYQIS